jgi:hypothetical protein
MAWQKGPMPPDTWGWGGVVPKGDDGATGFYFADFGGNCVELIGTEPFAPHGPPKVIRADQVAWYDNSLTLPPVEGVKGRVGASTPKE